MYADTGGLAKGGAKYTGNGIETDGNIITATGPDTAKEWGAAIVNKINGK
jgi:putative intracellular protease/amidase